MNMYWFGFCILLFMGWTGGAVEVGRKWAMGTYEAAQLKAVVKAEAAVAVDEKKEANITQGVSNDLEKNLAAIDSSYDADLGLGLQPAPANGDMPITRTAAGGYDGAACPKGLPGNSKQALLKLAKQADQQTARLSACQAWVKAQAAVLP
jgi:hypothetical protein